MVVKTTAVLPAHEGNHGHLAEKYPGTHRPSRMQFALPVILTLSLLTLPQASKFHEDTDSVSLAYNSISSS